MANVEDDYLRRIISYKVENPIDARAYSMHSTIFLHPLLNYAGARRKRIDGQCVDLAGDLSPELRLKRFHKCKCLRIVCKGVER